MEMPPDTEAAAEKDPDRASFETSGIAGSRPSSSVAASRLYASRCDRGPVWPGLRIFREAGAG